MVSRPVENRGPKRVGRNGPGLETQWDPGGSETLGTGFETPHPPTEGLAELYRWLEDEHAFAGTRIRTDYRFESPAEAAENTRFFFGDELADRILEENLTVLPECTGIWWRTI